MTTLPASSSHRIDLVDGGGLRKDLGPGGWLSAPVRPGFVEDPAREPAAYREVLGPLGVGPRCLDSGADWVVLERVDAPVLWEVGDPTVWHEVAAWAARLHDALSAADTIRVPLLEYDVELFGRWRRRASAAGVAQATLDAHARATEVLLSLPVVVLHGDLYPSNLLVRVGPPLEIWPVDWELMGRGPAVLDLAALTSGRWPPEVRDAMVAAYRRASGSGDVSDVALDAARLHLSVQWLGMPGGWEPPPWERHDWAADAERLARRF